MAFRTFIGTLATLTSSIVNLAILMVLRGEPGWICLMCCNADILFSVLVLHWVTQIDSMKSNSTNTNSVTASRAHASAIPPTHDPNNGFLRIPKTSVQIWAGDRTSEVDGKKAKIAGTTTTECYAGKKGDNGREDQEEIVEMHKITVRTEQTQEVEVDSMNSVKDVEYHTRSDSTERMV